MRQGNHFLSLHPSTHGCRVTTVVCWVTRSGRGVGTQAHSVMKCCCACKLMRVKICTEIPVKFLPFLSENTYVVISLSLCFSPLNGAMTIERSIWCDLGQNKKHHCMSTIHHAAMNHECNDITISLATT
jgi:hypothetical protein